MSVAKDPTTLSEVLHRIAVGAGRCLDNNGSHEECKKALQMCEELAQNAIAPLPPAPLSKPENRARLVMQVFTQMANELGRPELFRAPCKFSEGIKRMRALIHECGMAEKTPPNQTVTYKVLFETASQEPLGQPELPSGDATAEFFKEF